MALYANTSDGRYNGQLLFCSFGSDLSRSINVWFKLSVGTFPCRVYGMVVDCSILYMVYKCVIISPDDLGHHATVEALVLDTSLGGPCDGTLHHY